MTRFADPIFLLFLVLIPLLIWQYVKKARARQGSILFSDLDLVKKGRPGTARLFPHLPLLLRTAGLLLLILALARPQAGSTFREITSRGVDIILCLDSSTSMEAMDLKPDRFEAAKKVSEAFIKARPYDRIGLVIFAGIALTKCPLTVDHSALLSLLSSVKIGDTRLDGTAIGEAIAAAVNRLKKSPGRSKLIILVTDGRNNAGEISPVTAAKLAKAFGIKIYAIGVGTIGNAPFPVRDPLGNVHYVMSKEPLDEKTLTEIADTTGGLFFRAEDNNALVEVYSQINAMEKYEIKTRQFSQYRELYTLFLWPGLIMLLLEVILSRTILRELP
ncbi:MAG: VWA domain-containing protein [Candidatus Eremiobacteraeota bacterium]|nr:VWA domain-containing protein [Candidatus Eremiobacteraeota bacterium]